ncbi:hypothetical protein [Burkholderia contaminans]|uniref:GNAT family N-acetyltransferase n=1 Tax=Burkholderia contaminans TaxID=488447 RepID=A0A3N8PNA6_9BURK|nr:hypothetical protein [Burkholderia contaminans]RQT13111.1 hypothetical protein DF051_20830 [Burkholderia contaminans]
MNLTFPVATRSDAETLVAIRIAAMRDSLDGALRGSDSNRFYARHGFVQADEAEWDIYYMRAPGSATM